MEETSGRRHNGDAMSPSDEHRIVLRRDEHRPWRRAASWIAGRLNRTIPIQLSLGEGIDVAMDTGSPIDFTYQLPFAFTGETSHMTIHLGPLDIGERKTAKGG